LLHRHARPNLGQQTGGAHQEQNTGRHSHARTLVDQLDVCVERRRLDLFRPFETPLDTLRSAESDTETAQQIMVSTDAGRALLPPRSQPEPSDRSTQKRGTELDE